MDENTRKDFFVNTIDHLESTSPASLPNLKSLFPEYSISVVKKKEIPSAKFPDEVYADVLKTLHDYGRSIEQKPSMYSGKGEEEIRDLFLSLIESRYESSVATGESFNNGGKTDILLKTIDGKNLFVAECKNLTWVRKHA